MSVLCAHSAWHGRYIKALAITLATHLALVLGAESGEARSLKISLDATIDDPNEINFEESVAPVVLIDEKRGPYSLGRLEISKSRFSWWHGDQVYLELRLVNRPPHSRGELYVFGLLHRLDDTVFAVIPIQQLGEVAEETKGISRTVLVQRNGASLDLETLILAYPKPHLHVPYTLRFLEIAGSEIGPRGISENQVKAIIGDFIDDVPSYGDIEKLALLDFIESQLAKRNFPSPTPAMRIDYIKVLIEILLEEHTDRKWNRVASEEVARSVWKLLQGAILNEGDLAIWALNYITRDRMSDRALTPISSRECFLLGVAALSAQTIKAPESLEAASSASAICLRQFIFFKDAPTDHRTACGHEEIDRRAGEMLRIVNSRMSTIPGSSPLASGPAERKRIVSELVVRSLGC